MMMMMIIMKFSRKLKIIVSDRVKGGEGTRGKGGGEGTRGKAEGGGVGQMENIDLIRISHIFESKIGNISTYKFCLKIPKT